MTYYKHTYMAGFTTNDTYGNFYDGKKASLITVPDRLKNYDLDVKNTRTSTSGAEYGDFVSPHHGQPVRPEWPVAQYGQEPLEGIGRDLLRRPPPPPPMPRMPPPPPPLADPEPLASSREPPPPVSVERYRNPERREAADRVAAPHPARSRSPPPPPDLGTYRANMEMYTGRGQRPSPSPPPPPPPPPQVAVARPPAARPEGGPGGELLPALKYGAKEIHLPDIEAVELHMRDKSKIILNVREFYNRYLRD